MVKSAFLTLCAWTDDPTMKIVGKTQQMKNENGSKLHLHFTMDNGAPTLQYLDFRPIPPGQALRSRELSTPSSLIFKHQQL